MSTLVENVAKVTAAHAALKEAIAAKGVAVPEGTKLSDMAGLVEVIKADTAQSVQSVSFFGQLSGKVVLLPVIKCDFARATTLMHCFHNCSGLTSLTLPDGFGSAATKVGACFQNCSSLQNVTGAIKFPVSFDMHWSTKLTHESLLNIISGLVNVTSTQTLTLGATNLAKLTGEEKKIATDKGWTLV